MNGMDLNVYLIQLDDGPPLFYSERPRRSEPVERPKGGLRGWWDRSFRGLRAGVQRPKGKMGQSVRQLVGWLRRRIGLDETMLRSLRRVDQVILFHPTTQAPEAAESAWSAYLADRWRHHLTWFGVNLVIAPVSAIALMPVPGPNVVGFWFTFRAVSHLLAALGVRRARSGRLATSFEPCPSLDLSLSVRDDEAIGQVCGACNLRRLGSYLRRLPSRPSAPQPISSDRTA